MSRGLFVGALLLLSTAAFAAPQAIGDCEKIADPDGYNRCLAQFGPAMKGGRAVQAEPANADAPKASRVGRSKGRYAKRGGRGGRSFARGGRVRMEIAVGSGGGKRRGRRR